MTKLDYEIGDVGFLVQQIGELYSSPQNAFKEYSVNSVDAFQENIGDTKKLSKLEIGIVVNQTNGSILMQDNGVGMTYEFLSTIPQRIGLSTKRGLADLRGEKAFGMLAYQRFAEEMEVYSRSVEEGSGDINFLRMIAKQKQYEAKKVDEWFVGNTEYGTQIRFTGIPSEYIKRYFQPGKLKKTLSEIFSPLLREDFLNIKVGYLYKDGTMQKLEIVEPIDYSGDRIANEKFQINYVKHKQPKGGNGKIIVHVDPDRKNGLVNVYNKGILVGNVSLLEELPENPWKTGKVIGEINEDFMTLIPSREGYVAQPKKRSLFVEKIRNLEQTVKSELKTSNQDKTKNENEQYAQKILDTIRDSYQKIIGNYFNKSSLTKGKRGDPEDEVEDDPTTTTKTRMYGKRNNPTEKPGRPTVKSKPGGRKEKVRKGKTNQGNFIVEFDQFDLEENNLQSKLGLVGNVIMINTDHENYQLVKTKTSKDMQRYLGLAISKEIAYSDFKRKIEKEKLPPIEQGHILTELTMGLYQAICGNLKL